MSRFYFVIFLFFVFYFFSICRRVAISNSESLYDEMCLPNEIPSVPCYDKTSWIVLEKTFALISFTFLESIRRSMKFTYYPTPARSVLAIGVTSHWATSLAGLELAEEK